MIAIDWGTSSFRAYRLAADGSIAEKRAAPLGILAVQGGKFAEALDSQVGDWLEDGEAPVVMSGMIGSRQGWKEAPYAACPAGAKEIAAGMVEVRWGEGRRAWIAGPGARMRRAFRRDAGRGSSDPRRARPAHAAVLVDMPSGHPQQMGARERRPDSGVRYAHDR
jgi:2-keto-3-deoxy-galactonokinase